MISYDMVRYTCWTCSEHDPKKFGGFLSYTLASSAVSKKRSKNLKKLFFKAHGLKTWAHDPRTWAHGSRTWAHGLRTWAHGPRIATWVS